MRLVPVPMSRTTEVAARTIFRNPRVAREMPLVLGYCWDCGSRVYEGEAYADLDGTPWRAYYCPPCASNHLKEVPA